MPFVKVGSENSADIDLGWTDPDEVSAPLSPFLAGEDSGDEPALAEAHLDAARA